tara:strand:+ start:122 stop:334 length:213 start_codon:yes stop_codon:yes gene_type:complete
MLNNCNYNKVRILHDLSRISNFVKKHAKKDAKGVHKGCQKVYSNLHKDLEKHLEVLTTGVSGLAKKGKFK